jgi:protein-L-isoaspartate(D-aspartate) O-methyltransferase
MYFSRRGDLISVILERTLDRADEHFFYLRDKMVKEQIEQRGITDTRVLDAMRKVPRHLMVPGLVMEEAYEDHPQSIGYSQTISQPFIVAYMTLILQVGPTMKVLEIGTGSGYQTAVLAELSKKVYSIEIVKSLGERAKGVLDGLQYKNVTVKCGDGYEGWQEHSLFDRIIVTAAPKKLPEALVQQLAPNGRMVLPIGSSKQNLILISKDSNHKVHKTDLIPVRFVPMTGRVQEERTSMFSQKVDAVG